MQTKIDNTKIKRYNGGNTKGGIAVGDEKIQLAFQNQVLVKTRMRKILRMMMRGLGVVSIAFGLFIASMTWPEELQEAFSLIATGIFFVYLSSFEVLDFKSEKTETLLEIQEGTIAIQYPAIRYSTAEKPRAEKYLFHNPEEYQIRYCEDFLSLSICGMAKVSIGDDEPREQSVNVVLSFEKNEALKVKNAILRVAKKQLQEMEPDVWLAEQANL
jgi:hypothetical protein